MTQNKIDILAAQETKSPGNFMEPRKNYTWYNSCMHREDLQPHGGAIIMHDSMKNIYMTSNL